MYVGAPVDRDILVTATQLRSMIAEDIHATVEELDRTIRAAGLGSRQLTAIFLAGDSSAIPLVSSLISERLDTVPQMLDDPKTVVARAARHVLRCNVGARRTHPDRTARPRRRSLMPRPAPADMRLPATRLAGR